MVTSWVATPFSMYTMYFHGNTTRSYHGELVDMPYMYLIGSNHQLNFTVDYFDLKNGTSGLKTIIACK